MRFGDMILMKGNSDLAATVAANVVFPEPGRPYNNTLTRGVRSDLAT